MLHCSLSAVVDLLYPLGYTLLSVVVADAVFVKRSIRAQLGRGVRSEPQVHRDDSGDLEGAEGPGIDAEWLVGTYCHPAWPHESMVVRMQSEFVYDYRVWSDADRPLYERLAMIRSYLDFWDVPRSQYHLRLSATQAPQDARSSSRVHSGPPLTARPGSAPSSGAPRSSARGSTE